MKNSILTVALIGATWIGAGCGAEVSYDSDSTAQDEDAGHDDDGHDHDGDDADGHDQDAALADAQMLEVACGSCIFGMEGVSGCVTAVKVGDQAYLVEGGDLNAHAAGLCTASQQAEVVGHVEGDKFIATSIVLP